MQVSGLNGARVATRDCINVFICASRARFAVEADAFC